MIDEDVQAIKYQISKNNELLSELKTISDKIADAKQELIRKYGALVFSN